MLALLPATGRAGEARIVEASGAERVVIDARDACGEEIVEVLARRFEFIVERHAPPSRGICFSGLLEGSLDQLVERLLRHEGHIVVFSPEAPAGIKRVVLVEAKGAAPGAVMQDPFARMSVGLPQKTKSMLPELFAGTE
jgi:hypothetical protein